MRKFFIMLGIWFVAIISVIVGSIIYDKVKTSEYDDAATVYLEKALPRLSQWDIETTRSLMAPKALTKVPEKNFTQLIQLFSKMGAWKGMEEPAFSQIHSEDPEEGAIVEYKVNAHYEKGDAQITINLLTKNNQFSIYHFSLSSKVLTEE